MNAGITFIVCLALLGFYFTGYLIGKAVEKDGYFANEQVAFIAGATLIITAATALYALIKMITISIQIH